MTNPNNIVRVRARNNGRASVYEANAWCQAFSNGLLEGNGVLQNTSPDMNVLVGGTLTKPDVLIAQNPAGYKIALDIVGQQAIAITTPASGSRISSVVAYTDDLSLASTDTETTGSHGSCGLIVVNGASGTSPTAPSDSDIRSAITADGATGSQASYAIIANIVVASSSTALTATTINVQFAAIGSDNIGNNSILPRHLSPETNPVYEIAGGTSTGTDSFSITRTPTFNGIVQIISSNRLSLGEVIITPSITGLEDSQVSAETTTSEGGSGPVVIFAVGKCTAGTPFTYTLSKSASVSLLNIAIMITITPTSS